MYLTREDSEDEEALWYLLKREVSQAEIESWEGVSESERVGVSERRERKRVQRPYPQ